jgi:hypothetical protein
MRNYEQLIEYIINDDHERAQELFHALVVEKSREIYNDLVAEEMDQEMDEAEDMSMDQTDDMMGDIEADHEGMDSDDMDHDMDMDMDDMGDEDDFGDEHHGHEDMEDRVMDLEDALDELKAEFEALMADEAGEHHDMPAEGVVREYVEKVGEVYKGEFVGGPRSQNVGANTGDHENTGEKNTKSVVAGKNDMGGTTQNIARGGAGENPDDKQYKDPSNAYAKGKGNLPGAGNFENVPGAKAGKAFTNAKKPTTSEPKGVNKKATVAR